PRRRPADRAGRGADGQGVPPAVDARAVRGPGDEPRRAPAAGLGRAVPAAGSLGRRLRPQDPREGRRAVAGSHVRADALRHRLPVRVAAGMTRLFARAETFFGIVADAATT